MKRQDALSIYVHIPFCAAKCRYCDFLSAPADERTKESYIHMLKNEIQVFTGSLSLAGYRPCTNRPVVSVFIGGGTPSVLNGEQIVQVLHLIRESFSLTEDAEITVECNPGTLDEQKLRMYKEAGVNRLSMGLQSADNEQLKNLGRIHTWEVFVQNYEAARAAGFTNINVDLMSSLPGQSLASWIDTMEKVIALKPEHISAYSLIIEEGTPFYDVYHEEDEARARGEKTKVLPDEETERDMYYETLRFLEGAGYHRYEISNYAKDGYESVHNSGYWERREYIGFGLGAASCVDGCRYKKTSELCEYLQGDFTDREKVCLSKEDEMEETMFLGLRMMQGVSEQAFSEQFGQTLEDVYGPVLKKLIGSGLLAAKDGRVFLTEKGIDVSNMVLAEFLLS